VNIAEYLQQIATGFLRLKCKITGVKIFEYSLGSGGIEKTWIC
jgi:hypothetical protein